jgi:putative membrane protein
MEPVEPEITRRLHPSALLFDAGRRFASLVFWGVAALLFAARSEQGWYLLFLLPPIAVALVRYASFRYGFGDDQLVIREGLLVRKVRHVPYARIQNIDTVQGPLYRLLDVVEVRLETAGGSQPEAVFRVITGDQLSELRARVFGAVPESSGDAQGVPAEGRPFFCMRNEDVLLFGLLSQKGLVVLGGAFLALREFVSREELEERLGPRLEAVGEGARALGPWSWVALALGLLLLLQLGSVLWAYLTLHGFRIEREGEDLRTTCGLLTRQTASLPRGRVQFLEVRQSLIQRWLGRVSVRALSAGGDSTEKSQVARKWLVPLCRREDLGSILSEVQAEAGFDAVAWERVHPRAERRLRLRWGLVLGLPALSAVLYSWTLGLGALVAALALALLLARARVRALGYGLGPSAVFLRDGLLARRQACVRFEKIQSIKLSRTPFDRRAGMAHLSIDTAGRSGSQPGFVVPFLPLRTARRLARGLGRRAAEVAFRW